MLDMALRCQDEKEPFRSKAHCHLRPTPRLHCVYVGYCEEKESKPNLVLEMVSSSSARVFPTGIWVHSLSRNRGLLVV